MKAIIFLILIGLLIVPCIAIDENTKLSIIYSGEKTISNQIFSKSASISTIFKTETEKSFKDEKFPITVSNNFRIDSYKCDEVKCGYWLSTDKKTYINNPVYLIHGNYPYYSIVSEVEDYRTNTFTLTVKEDIKGATYRLLNDFVERL